MSDSSVSAPIANMSSVQNSSNKTSPNIAMLVKRFRHGKPRPPSSSTSSAKGSSIPSSDKTKYSWMSSTVTSSKSTPIPTEPSSLEDENFDSSIAELQNKVDQILRQSDHSLTQRSTIPTPLLTPPSSEFTSSDRTPTFNSYPQYQTHMENGMPEKPVQQLPHKDQY
uniref:Uncharacterized protein n=1 Tax=Ciona savignyi TaxID=51511 RepID=H2ZB79_CIOSA